MNKKNNLHRSTAVLDVGKGWYQARQGCLQNTSDWPQNVLKLILKVSDFSHLGPI